MWGRRGKKTKIEINYWNLKLEDSSKCVMDLDNISVLVTGFTPQYPSPSGVLQTTSPWLGLWTSEEKGFLQSSMYIFVIPVCLVFKAYRSMDLDPSAVPAPYLNQNPLCELRLIQKMSTLGFVGVNLEYCWIQKWSNPNFVVGSGSAILFRIIKLLFKSRFFS